jgi:integrase
MLGNYGSPESRAKYAALIAEAKVVPSTPEPKGPPTVSELMAAYFKYVDEYYGYKSAMWYHIKSFMKLLHRHFGTLPAKEFKAKRLKQLRDLWIGEGWSRKYINEQAGRLKRMYQWAASEEMLPAEVLHSLEMVQGLRRGKCKAHDPDPIEPVSDEVVAKTLECLGERVGVLVQVQRLCGSRPGELLKIRKKDINRTGTVWIVKLKKHKTRHRGKQRIIYFGPKALALLLPRLVCGDNDLVFPMRRDSYRQAVQRAAKRAGVPPWFPNQLRHTSGTAVREEMGLENAQLHLGHARCDVTQIYAETSQAKAIEVARRLG